MTTAPNTGLTFQNANSLRSDELYAELVNYLDAWLNCCVLAVGQAAPTGTEVDGDRYVVGVGTGLFAGHDDELAIKIGGIWQFYPTPFSVPIIKNLDDGEDYECVAGVWAVKAAGASALSALTDVDLAGLADGDALVWDAGAAKWVPGAGGGGGGGGDYECLSDIVVTTAQQDIDFAGVDLDADAKYVIELAYVPAATGDRSVNLLYNADFTATNYKATLFYTDGGSASGFAINSAYAFSCGDGTIHAAYAKFEISKVAGHKPRASITLAARATGGVRSMLNSHEWSSTTNVTAIKLRHTDAAGFAAGTRARLYRLNTNGASSTGMVLIGSDVAGAGGVASLGVSSIPNIYSALKVVYVGRGLTASGFVDLRLRCNGDSGANYDYEQATFTGGVPGYSGTYGATYMELGYIAANSAPAGRAGVAEVSIPDYANTFFDKQGVVTTGSVVAASSSGPTAGVRSGCWRPATPVAITSIELTMGAGNHAEGSKILVYGLP